jgi:hypothetical protein
MLRQMKKWSFEISKSILAKEGTSVASQLFNETRLVLNMNAGRGTGIPWL